MLVRLVCVCTGQMNRLLCAVTLVNLSQITSFTRLILISLISLINFDDQFGSSSFNNRILTFCTNRDATGTCKVKNQQRHIRTVCGEADT